MVSRADIVPGGLYCDGKGTRRVIEIRRPFLHDAGRDEVVYVGLSGEGKRKRGRCLVASFAAWAKYRCHYVEAAK